ncbi:hypothetical protein Tco_0861881 [Tanacetum coccineum]
MLNPLRSRNTDRYYDYHQEKGHYTNDCIQLRKQLEMALEWGKLNYLVKDVRQRERGSHGREAPQPAKNKGQIEGNSNGFRKVSRRNIETTRKDRTGGRPRLKTLRAIPSTIHSMMKFQTSKGVATLVTRTIIIAECRRLEKKQMIEESFEGEGEVAATEEVLVNPSFPDQRVTIGGGLSETCREQLKCLLKDNMWVFAWEPSDMMGVPRRIIEHTLNVNPSMDPVCQKRRTFSMEKRRNLEAYVDDMVVKSKYEKMLLANIAKIFDNLRKINMKLNLKKCPFRVEEGKFLEYMVTSEGIRVNHNPKKTKALVDLQSPRTLKEMQSLSGKLDSLNCFLAKSAERSLPFFNTLKNITKENKHEYRWTEEAKEAF